MQDSHQGIPKPCKSREGPPQDPRKQPSLVLAKDADDYGGTTKPLPNKKCASRSSGVYTRSSDLQDQLKRQEQIIAINSIESRQAASAQTARQSLSAKHAIVASIQAASLHRSLQDADQKLVHH